jgi:hypothetical protein
VQIAPQPKRMLSCADGVGLFCAHDLFKHDFLCVVGLFVSSFVLLCAFGELSPGPISAEKCADRRVVIIGDVHGCLLELQLMLRRARLRPGCDMLYFTGDLIGKGPSSVEVLREVRSLMLMQGGLQVEAQAVLGNHEARFLQWLGARPPRQGYSLSDAYTRWTEALTPEEIDWIRRRPLWAALPPEFGNTIVVHAGMEPGVPPIAQARDTLLSIRSLHTNGTATSLPGGGKGWAAAWPDLVFGHDARRKLQVHPHATGIDTGAVYGGVLTALIVRPAKPSAGAHTPQQRELLHVGAQPGSCGRATKARGRHPHRQSRIQRTSTIGRARKQSDSHGQGGDGHGNGAR